MIKMWIIFKFGYFLIVLIQVLCFQERDNNKEKIKCSPIANYSQYIMGYTYNHHILTNESSEEVSIIEYNDKNNLKLEFKIKCEKSGHWRRREIDEISDKNNNNSDDICHKNSTKYYLCFYEGILVICKKNRTDKQFNDKNKNSNNTALYVMIGILITLIIPLIIWFRFKNREPIALPAVVYNNYTNEISFNNSNDYYSIDYRYASSHFVNEENLSISNVSQNDQMRENSIYESNENSEIKSYK
jgi:hypothetical protein